MYNKAVIRKNKTDQLINDQKDQSVILYNHTRAISHLLLHFNTPTGQICKNAPHL